MRRLPRDRGAFCRVRPPRGPFRAPAWCAVAAGRRGQLPHVFVGFERTATRPLFVRYSRAPSRPRALARLLQADVSTSTTTDHFEHPERPESVVGTIASIGRKLRFGPGNRQSFTGTGVEEHRASTLPTGIAPGRDFAPTLIAPGTSCRENRSFPCPERRGRRAEPPAQHTLAPCAPREGRAALDLREEAERSPTRGAFCRQAVRDASGRDCRGPAKAEQRPRQRLFHHRRNRARDARSGSDGSASRHGKR
jgi:hypothetical protein